MSAVTLLNPSAIAQPLGAYSQALLCRGAGDWLHLSGQIGVSPSGELAPDVQQQAENVWSNIIAILRDAGMTASDLIKITTYGTSPDALAVVGAVRSRYLNQHRPASTVVVVSALARPEWLVEVDAVAFRADA